MFKKKVFIIVVLLISLVHLTVSAQEVSKTGTTAAKFLSIGIGARANAMGGAFTAVANDASAMYWNAAGIASLTKYEALFTYTKLFADINLNYFGAVLPLGELGVIGFNITAVNIGEMDVTTEYFPDGTGETFSPGSYAFGLSIAKLVTEEFAVGLSAKYVREDIYNSSASAFAFDVGTIFTTPFYDIKFSSSISNYGSKMQMEGDDLLVRHDPDPGRAGNNETVDAYYATDAFELPLKLQIGLSREFIFLSDQRFTLAVEAAHPNDNSQYVNIGGELALFQEMVQLRGGYKTLFLDDSQEGLTLGMGINYGGLSYFNIGIDYAYQQFEFLGDTHSFGILLKF